MDSAPASDTAPDAGPLDPLAQRYLDHVRFEKRLANRTATLYALDLARLTALAQAAGLDLTAVQLWHQVMLGEHPFDVPEILAVDCSDGLPDYLQWALAAGSNN